MNAALNKYFTIFESTKTLASELVRVRRHPIEVLIILCARLDALASDAVSGGTSNKTAFTQFLRAYSGNNELFESVSVGELYYELRYHRWLLEGMIPQAGRLRRFSTTNDRVIQLLEEAGLPLTLTDSAKLLDSISQILQHEFRVKPGQPLSKPRLIKESELVQKLVRGIQKTPLRAHAANLPTALRGLVESTKVCTILYDRFRCEAIHGAAIVLNEERFFNENQLYWEPRYSEYHGAYEFLEFPAQFLLGCVETCVKTYRHHLKAKGKIPPDVFFHVFGDDMMSNLELLDYELLPEDGPVRLNIKHR